MVEPRRRGSTIVPVMTDAESEQVVDEPIATHYLETLDEAIEHLRAADLLGFGVRLASYLEQASGESFVQRWRLDLLPESPVQADDEGS